MLKVHVYGTGSYQQGTALKDDVKMTLIMFGTIFFDDKK